MKRIFLLLIIFLSWKMGLAQYKPVDQGSSVQFTIQNFGFDVNGTFKGLHGTIVFDSKKPEDAHFDVELDANSVNTDNSIRDNHLRDENYFDVKKHPTIQLESIKIEAGNKLGSYS
ncbi:MAG TPA: YceI family protein, partial [Mucilaginibacter sp.]|nr:YceI family protein [Mucilaginibacter sp.]